MDLSLKQKTFSRYSSRFLKSTLNFGHFQKKKKKKKILIVMYFRNYGLRKTGLDKSLKSPVSEDPSTGNMVNGPKQCCNLNDSTFTTFIYHCEGN